MPAWYDNVPSTSPTSHDLALLFMLFCFGSLTDMNLPAPPDNPLSDRFYQLAKCALTLDPNAPAGYDDNPLLH